MSSARNGMTGAISPVSVVSASKSVWYAASESRCERSFQKRARFRRRYHVDRSSQKASMLKSALRAS